MANFNVTSGNAFRFSISAECVNDNLRVRINNESLGDLYSINNSGNGEYGNVVVVENSNPIKDPSDDNVLVGLLSYGNSETTGNRLFQDLGDRIIGYEFANNFPFNGELLLREQRFNVSNNQLIETNYYSFAVDYQGGNISVPPSFEVEILSYSADTNNLIDTIFDVEATFIGFCPSLIVDKGIRWGLTSPYDDDQVFSDTYTSGGNTGGTFQATATGNTIDTVYWVQGFVTDDDGITSYSDPVAFVPILKDLNITQSNSSGSLVISGNTNYGKIFAFAGGGGGGSSQGDGFTVAAGGGGAGGGFLKDWGRLTQTISYTIGSGGASDTNGQNTIFSGVTLFGGGAGGENVLTRFGTGESGSNGGSGGGAANGSGLSGGAGVTGQGNDGCGGSGFFSAGAGGGGGFISAGAGAGGAGGGAGIGLILNWFDGVNKEFAKGGGGRRSSPQAGAANTGSGGDGGLTGANFLAGGAGSTGGVISITSYNLQLPNVPEVTYSQAFTAVTVFNQADITEPTLDNVDFYELYRADTSGGTYSVVDTGITLTLSDNTAVYGETYWYYVRAVNQYYSAQSEPVPLSSTTADSVYPINTFEFVEYDISQGSYFYNPIFSWIQPPDPESYTVNISTDGVNFTTVETFSSGTTTYTDTVSELAIGETYFYNIQYTSSGITSSPSNIVEINYNVVPAPINLVDIALSAYTVTFGWDKNTPSNVIGYNYELQILVNGVWTTFGTVQAPTTEVNISGLEPETQYAARVIGVDNDSNEFAWDNNILFFTTPIVPVPIPFSDLDEPFTVQDGTCGNNDCSITIFEYDTYSYFYDFSLTDINGTEYTINASGVFTGLESGYYFLEVIPTKRFLRDTFSARWIAATDTNTTVTVQESIVNHTDYSIRRTGQRWNSSATLTANQVGDWDVYRENPIQVGDQDATQSITINGLQPQYRYYYSFTSDADECKFLGSFYIKCEDGMTQGGIQKVFIAPWTTNSALIVDEKVSGFTESLTWYQLPTEPSNTFTQGYNRDVQGVFYNDILTIGVANDGFVDWNDVEFVLDKPWIVVFQDNNDNYWVFGHDNGAQSDVLSKNTGDFQENNAFTIGFADPHADGVLMALNKTYVEQNIL